MYVTHQFGGLFPTFLITGLIQLFHNFTYPTHSVKLTLNINYLTCEISYNSFYQKFRAHSVYIL